jgi:hypothetical protein
LFAYALRETPLVEINNREGLEAWLQKQPREVAVALAARAALRVLPLIQNSARYGSNFPMDIALAVFRAAAVSWMAAKYPSDKSLRAEADSAATAAGAASTGRAPPAFAAAAAARAGAARGSVARGHAAEAAEAAYKALYEVIADAYADSITGSVENWDPEREADYGTSYAAPLWQAVTIDAIRVEEGATASDIAELPLWLQDQSGDTYRRVEFLWQKMKEALRAANQNWEVWIDWYEDRLYGPRPDKWGFAYIGIDNDLWNQGPAIVNPEIKRRIEGLEPPPQVVELSASGIATTSGLGFPSINVKEPKPRRRRKKEPKPSPVSEIPPQRPAALEPVWSNGILVLPSTSAEIDGDREALASALKVLRQEIVELADDADGEANIDKRPIVYLRRNAERIPDHAPTQDELFRLAHVKEFLEGYSKTVGEEWPDFLARRFHTLTLHFDRTIRQFPKWRAFVRNANKDRLTPEQAAEVPVLAHAMVDALRDEDAREFIDPLIPTALENLQAPMKSNSENAAQAQLPAIRTEGLLIAEDTVESINNIVKEAVAAALSDAKVPVALSRTKTAGKKVPKGIGATAKAAASGYADEAQKSVVKEAKRLGKETGPAVTQWVKRLVFGSKVVGGAAGGYGLAHLLIRVFPDKFQWLLHLMPFFS